MLLRINMIRPYVKKNLGCFYLSAAIEREGSYGVIVFYTLSREYSNIVIYVGLPIC